MINNMVRYPTFANSGDRFKYARRLGKHVAAGKTGDRPAFCVHEIVANQILRIVAMLATVQFDDQFDFPASEIGNARTDWHLQAKFYNIQISFPDGKPQPILGQIAGLAKNLCQRRQAGFDLALSDSPSSGLRPPSPRKQGEG
jgi:hypothetical protein